MRFFFDARFTRTGHHDGISRYGAGLLGPLRELTDVTAIICDQAQLSMLPNGIDYVQTHSPMSARELAVGSELNTLGADVVFSPMQVMGSAGRRYGLILTLHDTIYYSHPTPPADLPAPVRAAWWLYHQAQWPQRLVLDRADVVATVSAVSRADILDRRLTSRPVVVIPNAADLGQAPQDHPGCTSRDLLYMGSFMSYKDVETLLAAMVYLPEYTLRLLSKVDGLRLSQLRAVVPDGAQVIFHDGVSDAEYLDLLRRSHALVSASRAEGFGLPVVEAMSQGLPVVVSDIRAFAEVGAGAAARFPAGDAVALAAQVRRLADPAVWHAAAADGLVQAGHYSWRRSAERLVGLAEQVQEIRARSAARR